MMQYGTEHRVVATPNVTPMIDVMLVLLIIFMVVTPTLLNGVHTEVPVAENLKAHPVEGKDHTVAIDAHGALLLDSQPIAATDLRAALTALFPADSTNRVLYLRAYRFLPYEQVTEVLEVARASGVAVVGLVGETRPR
jgi:biopolymer transport protein TolR